MAQGSRGWWWWLWPGLRPLWMDHSYPALALAAGASLLLNLLLAAQFVWTEWLGPTTRLGGWMSVLCIWCVASAVTWLTARRDQHQAAGDGEGSDPLAAAVDEYLQGKWYEAERLLRKQLRRQRKDVEAMLMLATLCRHTGRLDEAERRLDDLAALEAAGKWEVEIAAERRLVQRRKIRDQQTEDQSETEQIPEMSKAA
jgi:hypothetical protein